MLFTRTIRRKMLAGLVSILVMLIALSAGGLSGLRSYRHVVDDVDLSVNQVPSRTDLTESVCLLLGPLNDTPLKSVLDSPAAHRQFAAVQQAEFEQLLGKTEAQVKEYYRKLDQLPPSDAVVEKERIALAALNAHRQFAAVQQVEFEQLHGKAKDQVAEYYRKLDLLPPSDSVVAKERFALPALGNLDEILEIIDKEQVFLGEPDKRSETADKLRKDVNRLIVETYKIPDYGAGLNEKLVQAEKDYRAHRQIIYWTSAFAVVLFLWVGISGYTGIFSPLKKLHQGARRVAQGDFAYRLEQKTQDEMAELADAFNLMTTRFQEVTNDLDRQVRERSKQLVRSERLAGIGFLAAGVGHEINNPLSAITMAADSLLGRLAERTSGSEPEDDDVTQYYLAMIQREAEHCRQITVRLLDFARGQGESRCQNDLTTIVSEVIGMVQHLSKFHDRKIEFARTDSCLLEVNGTEIKQVVLNLVANCMESMTSGGTLHVSLDEQTDQVILKFRDEGCGMAPDVIENLFEPFFTHGKQGKGTGLGMAISQRIVGDHGGTIEASSDGAGKGSTFVVHLPRKMSNQSPVAA